MMETIIQLIILFFVIFDPLASFTVFFLTTDRMSREDRNKTAAWAVILAAAISYTVLIFGQKILTLFSTNITDFKVAGGIILAILGIQMALGRSITDVEKLKNNSAKAIAAIIATPLLTGPAAITAIMVSVHDYGMLISGFAITIVLAITGFLFFLTPGIRKFTGTTAIQVMSTLLGLVTITWGIRFIKEGLGL